MCCVLLVTNRPARFRYVGNTKAYIFQRREKVPLKKGIYFSRALKNGGMFTKLIIQDGEKRKKYTKSPSAFFVAFFFQPRIASFFRRLILSISNEISHEKNHVRAEINLRNV